MKRKLVVLAATFLLTVSVVKPAVALNLPAPPGDPTSAWFFDTVGHYALAALLMAAPILFPSF